MRDGGAAFPWAARPAGRRGSAAGLGPLRIDVTFTKDRDRVGFTQVGRIVCAKGSGLRSLRLEPYLRMSIIHAIHVTVINITCTMKFLELFQQIC